MKKVFLILLGIILISGLSFVSCQKKETSQKKAGEAVEKAKEAVSGYGETAGGTVEKAKEEVSGYGKTEGEAVEKAKEVVSGYGGTAGGAVEKAKEELLERLGGYGK